MTDLHWAGVLAAALLAAFGLWGWLARRRPWPRITEVACEHMAMTVTETEARHKQWRCLSHGCVMTEGYVAYDRDVRHALGMVAEDGDQP